MKKLISGISSLAGSLFLAMPAFAEGGEVGIANPTDGWNHLWNELLIDITVIGVVFGVAAIYMFIAYRAKDPNAHGRAPKLTRAQALSWAMIPAFIFMADDFFLSAKGWTLWNIQRRVPENAMEVKVTAMMYSWEYDYGNGVTTDELVVPVGQPVVLRMTSTDVIHSFFLPVYRVKEDVMPGRVTFIWFYPAEAKETLVTCTEFCGVGHTIMQGKVRAVPREEFDTWLAGQKA